MALSTAPKDVNNPFPRTADVTNSGDMSRSFSGWEPKKLWLTPADGGRSTECAFAEGFDSRADGRSLVSADLDGDGDQDLVMRNRAEPKLQLFENEGAVGHSVELQLVPASGSPEGEAAQVFEGGRVFPVVLARGYASGVDPIVHIGLGARTSASVEVRWRSGKRTTHSIPAGRRVRVFENGSEELVAAYQPKLREAAKSFPTKLEALGLKAEKDLTVVQLFLKGCKPCEEEVPALSKLKEKGVQLVSVGLHEGAALQEAAKAMGITWPVATLPNDVADALSTSGNLPFPILLVYRKGVLERVLPGPRGVEAVLSETTK